MTNLIPPLGGVLCVPDTKYAAICSLTMEAFWAAWNKNFNLDEIKDFQ